MVSITRGCTVLVVAAMARNSRQFSEIVIWPFETRGIALTGDSLVEGTTEAAANIYEAVDGGVRMAIVGGGDGPLRAILPLFTRRAVLLGVLLPGTANNFARSKGWPMDFATAVDVITDGTESRVDVGLLNGIPCANNLPIGYSREVIRATPVGMKRWLASTR